MFGALPGGWTAIGAPYFYYIPAYPGEEIIVLGTYRNEP